MPQCAQSWRGWKLKKGFLRHLSNPLMPVPRPWTTQGTVEQTGHSEVWKSLAMFLSLHPELAPNSPRWNTLELQYRLFHTGGEEDLPNLRLFCADLQTRSSQDGIVLWGAQVYPILQSVPACSTWTCAKAGKWISEENPFLKRKGKILCH